jgi:tetratricopeptide (TPR) repeat protein
MGQFENCIPLLKKSLELDKHPIGYTNLGTVYFYLKRYQEAVPMFEEAVRLDPGSENLTGNLADAYRWAGKTHEANVAYEHAIELGLKGLTVNPRDAARMGRISQYYAKKGDKVHASEFIRRALAIDPDDATLVYDQAVVSWLADKQQEALNSLQEALAKGYSMQDVQNDPEVAKLLQLAQFAQVRTQGAIQSKQ